MLLIAIRIDGLLEVPGAIKQPDSNKGKTEITRALAVIAAQDTKPSRVDRQTLVDPIFHRKIRNGTTLVGREPALKPG